jgi:alpha,alpha-trehalose phosphorylase
MNHHGVEFPSEEIYPIDEWRIVQAQFAPQFYAQDETLFTVANGYLGIRGNFEETEPFFQRGTFINGFYESWPIHYPEDAFGFAETGQTMLNATDAHCLELFVDGEPFHLHEAEILNFKRILDMKTATLSRDVVFETLNGKKVNIVSRRFTSLVFKNIAFIEYELTLLNADADVEIQSQLICEQENIDSDNDPRKSRSFAHEVFVPTHQDKDGERLLLGHRTANSRLNLMAGMDHVVISETEYTTSYKLGEHFGEISYLFRARQGQSFKIIKAIAYSSSSSPSSDDDNLAVNRFLDDAIDQGFDQHHDLHIKRMTEFWASSDMRVDADTPRIQQCLRLNLFHIIQASACCDGFSIGARGLTGSAYEGHYFWDTEVYVLPFLIYTQPHIARQVLKYRYNILNKARKRAKEVNQLGALYPWRTINGDEASAYFAAGTAQYHINADIMYSLKKYIDVTGDFEFLWCYGAEMLIETARLWYDLGFFSYDDGKFHIHGVTGPDEYTAIVNNNLFTNMMARENLRYAVETVNQMADGQPERFEELCQRIRFNRTEIDDWQHAADHMYLPYNQKLNIHPQDDQFLSREVWDFNNTPKSHYPLLLHYHPLVLYRFQVIKQADVVMVMFLLGHEFSAEEKKSNFDYYEPLTTGDSSLSACTQGILAAELGYEQLAQKYFARTAMMDFSDVCGNARDGAHIAAMGGTWLSLVYGRIGLRDSDGTIRFDPRPPALIDRIAVRLTIRGTQMEVRLAKTQITYTWIQGANLCFEHRGQSMMLGADARREIHMEI